MIIMKCPMSSICLVYILADLSVIRNRSSIFHSFCVQEAQG